MRKTMLKNFLMLFVLTSLVLCGYAQQPRYTVQFYNLENLFDTIDTPGVHDEEFTPTGAKKWTGVKYWKKIGNLAEVFYGVAAATGGYPVIIGMSEMENRNVLEDIAANEKLLPAGYAVCHYDSPDARGVDVAFFYRPDVFKYQGSRPLKMVLPGEPDFRTRDILEMWGTIGDQKVCAYVCHWPSRLEGQQASEYKRMAAARVVRNAVDSLRRTEPDTRIIIMGDMNDDPTDPSMAKVLNAKRSVDELKPGDLYNPFFQMFKDGYGTLAYRDAWNLFDNIVVSENLVNAPAGELKLYRSPKRKYAGYIFDRPFLRNKSGQYKNYPLRTFVGDTFQGGYSDHFSTYIILTK